MTTAILALSRAQSKIQKKIKTAELPGVNWKVVCIFSVLMCLASLGFYIYQVVNLTGGTYSINSYEKQYQAISQENKKLEFGFAENSFLGQVLSKTQEMGFQKTASVKYISVPANSVAIKK
jgi:hypothetical protein